jgi:hypothetical protein
MIFAETMLLLSLTTSTLYNDSKFSTQFGQLLLFFPLFIFMGVQAYAPTKIMHAVYIFSWMPTMPALTLLQIYLGCLLEYSEIIESDLWIILLANIPLYILLYLYLDSIITN